MAPDHLQNMLDAMKLETCNLGLTDKVIMEKLRMQKCFDEQQGWVDELKFEGEVMKMYGKHHSSSCSDKKSIQLCWLTIIGTVIILVKLFWHNDDCLQYSTCGKFKKTHTQYSRWERVLWHFCFLVFSFHPGHWDKREIQDFKRWLDNMAKKGGYTYSPWEEGIGTDRGMASESWRSIWKETRFVARYNCKGHRNLYNKSILT